MSENLQVVCPECSTLNPKEYAYCFRCGSSLERAQAVELLHPPQEFAHHSPKATGSPGFFAWWFRPSVTLVLRWPIVVFYPLAGVVALLWIATLVIATFPYDPVTCGIGVCIGLPVLLAPAASFFWTLPRIYSVWTAADIEDRSSRVLMTLGFLVLPIVLYVIVTYSLGFAIRAIVRLSP